MKTFQRGENMYVSVETRNLVGVLANVTSVAASIYDPKRTKVVNSTALSATATGKYAVSISLAATWMRGTYLLRVEVTNNTDIIYTDENFFLEVITDAD